MGRYVSIPAMTTDMFTMPLFVLLALDQASPHSFLHPYVHPCAFDLAYACLFVPALLCVRARLHPCPLLCLGSFPPVLIRVHPHWLVVDRARQRSSFFMPAAKHIVSVYLIDDITYLVPSCG